MGFALLLSPGRGHGACGASVSPPQLQRVWGSPTRSWELCFGEGWELGGKGGRTPASASPGRGGAELCQNQSELKGGSPGGEGWLPGHEAGSRGCSSPRSAPASGGNQRGSGRPRCHRGADLLQGDNKQTVTASTRREKGGEKIPAPSRPRAPRAPRVSFYLSTARRGRPRHLAARPQETQRCTMWGARERSPHRVPSVGMGARGWNEEESGTTGLPPNGAGRGWLLPGGSVVLGGTSPHRAPRWPGPARQLPWACSKPGGSWTNPPRAWGFPVPLLEPGGAPGAQRGSEGEAKQRPRAETPSRDPPPIAAGTVAAPHPALN